MNYKIAVFPGDGVGPEVINEGMKVVDKIAELDNFAVKWAKYPHNAESYLEKKELLDQKTLEEIRNSCKAVYMGPLGDPKVGRDVLEEGIIQPIRSFFDQYANLRPVRLLPGIESPVAGKSQEHIDFTIIRENTEDFYVGIHGRANGKDSFKHRFQSALYPLRVELGLSTNKGVELAYQMGVLSRKGSERIIRYAFDYARAKGKKKVTAIHKENTMDSYSLWREVFEETARNYGDVEKELQSVNAVMALFLMSPEKYNVIVAPNMFGEIISNLGAVIQGGFGLSASASINPEGISMFQPMHGSAPNFAGRKIVNPIAAVWSASLMLDSLGQQKGAALVMRAIDSVLKEGKCRTQDLGGLNSTAEMGDAIVNKIIDLHE
ncbi:isocitrate/isopropylmalate dehydrogenase family protein [Candidatus Woesearchaeota archaeon]|nr:isocitrate/isopropylmalate dehydrogenase family protein [Candidatus Woesearchaeota archaeon]